MAKALHSRWLQLIIILSSTIFNKTTKLLNVGCGLKIAKNGNWTNIDMGTQSTANVIRCNLLNGFPFGDDEFDVVYHSQVLEHFPKDKSAYFIAECFRVLKPGGILRVVVPDLEDIARTYLDQLQALRTRPTQESEVRYDWILLEMYDQTVRNFSGGDMAIYLQNLDPGKISFIEDRIGRVGRSIVESVIPRTTPAISKSNNFVKSTLRSLRDSLLPQLKTMKQKEILSTELENIGRFRRGGEIHYWMYDEYSLMRLLKQAGFQNIKRMSADSSMVDQWTSFQLDIIDGHVCDPTSLFMEAIK